MSEKHENPSATFNIPLNNKENDIFRIGCAHLQHFININVKTDDCKPMMLKMHLELDDTSPSSIEEAAERNIEQNSSINGLRQSVQQLEEEMKALKDALLQAMDDVVNRIDHAPKDDNNATPESITNKQANNENKISDDEQHNDIVNVDNACGGHHTNTMPKKMQEVIDLRDNCVYIQNFQCSDSSLEKAFCNVRKLANEMNVEIPDDSVIHIDVRWKRENYLDYYVYFCNADTKEEFLKNRHFYVYHPETSPLRILDYSEWGIVDIMNVQSSDLSLETAYANVMKIAMLIEMLITISRSDIDHIDVFSTEPNFLTYSVQFRREYMRKEFLQRKNNLNIFPDTRSLIITDKGGHRLSFRNVNNVSITVGGAYVIGLAELIGLSLGIDNLKRIYVLNYLPQLYEQHLGFYFIVEFSSKQVKDEFLEQKDILDEVEYFKYDFVTISDINENKKNCKASIEYIYEHVAIGISFIGLAKQLGFSLTPEQIQHFFDLSNFMYEAMRWE